MVSQILVGLDNEDLPLSLGVVKQHLIITCLIFCSQNSQTKRGKEACCSVPLIPAFANSDACLFFPTKFWHCNHAASSFCFNGGFSLLAFNVR